MRAAAKFDINDNSHRRGTESPAPLQYQILVEFVAGSPVRQAERMAYSES
jgi:hypothetical protein